MRTPGSQGMDTHPTVWPSLPKHHMLWGVGLSCGGESRPTCSQGTDVSSCVALSTVFVWLLTCSPSDCGVSARPSRTLARTIGPALASRATRLILNFLITLTAKKKKSTKKYMVR